MTSPTLTAKTQYITATNGVRYAYRILNPSDSVTATSTSAPLPLVMHMHFRGNLDFWDPALLDPLAAERPVLIFDQAGVGRSSGEVSTTIQGWAEHLIALVDALQIPQIDLFGFSMGGLAVQQVALTRPSLVRKLIIAGAMASRPGPQETGAGIVWPPDSRPDDVYPALDHADADDMDAVRYAQYWTFFPHSEAGKRAAEAYQERIARRDVPDEPTRLHFLGRVATERQVEAQTEWATYNPRNSWDRLSELKMPVLVANGDDDMLIPTSQSWALAKRIDDAGLIIYPKAGHGFLWQYATQFAKDINAFLTGPWPLTP